MPDEDERQTMNWRPRRARRGHPERGCDRAIRAWKTYHSADAKIRKRMSMNGFDWRNYIHADPEIMVGKPVVIGTRLTVEFILRLLAAGWSHEQIFENYPNLTEEALRAVFAFAAESMLEESMYPLPAAGD
jgi:uncharacterized protein (DUF433 family)